MVNKGFLFFGICFIIISLIFSLYIYIVNVQSKRKFIRVSKQFDLDGFTKFDIRFREMSYRRDSFIAVGGMYFFDAILYYSEDLIIIKQRKIFSVLLSTSLLSFPLLLARNPDTVYKGLSTKSPYSISKFGSFRLKIKYRTKFNNSEISIIPLGNQDIKAELEKKLLMWLK